MTAPPIRVSCPKCGKQLQTPADKAGCQFPCPSCGEKILVPGLAGRENPKADPPPDSLPWFCQADDALTPPGKGQPPSPAAPQPEPWFSQADQQLVASEVRPAPAVPHRAPSRPRALPEQPESRGGNQLLIL